MTAPRNVTPGHDRPSFEERDPRSAPEWLGWSWASRGRSFPWLGVLLVVVGAALLIQYFVPALSATTLILGALAIALLAGWLVGRSQLAMVLGLLVAALVAARLADELNIYRGPGTTSLCLGIALLFVWLVETARRGRGPYWALWGAAIFGLIGVVQVAGRIVDIPEFSGLWPALLIVVGLIVLLNARRGRHAA